MRTRLGDQSRFPRIHPLRAAALADSITAKSCRRVAKALVTVGQPVRARNWSTSSLRHRAEFVLSGRRMWRLRGAPPARPTLPADQSA